MVDPKLIPLLRCPIDGVRLELAEESLIKRVNDAIARGEVRDRQDQKILSTLDAGLVDVEGRRLYPVRESIPTLIGDQAIELADLR